MGFIWFGLVSLICVHKPKLHQVYDVTPFMEDHPGGDEVLLAATGNFEMTLFFITTRVNNVSH